MHVPGWHEKTKELQASGRLQMVGLIQEQNPDRCRLFMEWQQMSWPVLVDTFDLLEIAVVPLTVAIDEYGIVRHVGLKLADADRIEEIFLDVEYEAPDSPPEFPLGASRSLPHRGRPDPRAAPAQWAHYARELAVWAGERGDDGWRTDRARLDSAIQAYERVLRDERPDEATGWTHFRLAAAYRWRHDSPSRQAGDFQRAVDLWGAALEIDPNNYIWRRRIQQYGPVAEKPYPFYDWVARAREDIVARGATPPPLASDPTAAERADPSRPEAPAFALSYRTPRRQRESDPRGRILRDSPGDPSRRLIEIDTALVPAQPRAGEATQLHLSMRPNARVQAHWNNETDETEVWLEAAPGWQLDAQRYLLDNAPTAVSTEERSLEVELVAPDAESTVAGSPGSLLGYVLYYVCEDADGTCLYRRQDIEVALPGVAASGGRARSSHR